MSGIVILGSSRSAPLSTTTFPDDVEDRNRRYVSAAPATTGANVLTIGMKRAMMIVLPPCRS
jgi:hypothetical protein